jgi:hypothetical protein
MLSLQKGNFTLLQNVWMESEYQLDVNGDTSSTCTEALYNKIDFGSCTSNLISECSDVVPCLFQNIFPR